ncbi:putative carbohydrate esterase family 9 protein [Lyophyllum shimeji]|uniref:Carbohydrate esterase family 9 protein n=1 Tax=Lyophyllum shimeji TaxID=47721 RepID=A0A9P3PL77_LYOSH|nr:putative carbohydrate esterase family 9 protein [Lyophyllum shimeji]
MDKLPFHRGNAPPKRAHPFLRSPLFAVVATLFTLGLLNVNFKWHDARSVELPINAAEILRKCSLLDAQPGPPPDFHLRTQSDRFQEGTPPTLIRNATIWTGRVSGHETVVGDLLLDKGIIKAVGNIAQSTLDAYDDLVVVDVKGAWVSPGIVDMHSHLGVDSVPALKGSDDTNSLKGLVLPWLRSLDGLNTHDEAYRLSVSGGVTTSVVLPGSADAIGGQAFVIKLRPTAERSSSSMLLEPPFSLNNSDTEHLSRPRWRQMKHACGENPSRVYSGTRMDTIWAFRQGYDTARKIKERQDKYCAKARASQWDNLGEYPEDLQWEALVDVLRGRVKVHNHCYEATDLDGIVRLSNEFNFPIAAFHHAHETYLVPDLIKRAYGLTPAVALFATNARYKREAYRGSEFAPRILADNGLRVVMKSDHPVLNSRHLIYEAQQAHYYGLPDNLALAAVTSTPATVIGQDHRIGFIKEGYDADVIVWDSHPLALGATPKQVYIDGIAQIASPFSVDKPAPFQEIPETPNFDNEAKDALKYDGLPPLEPAEDVTGFVVFTNVSSIYLRRGHTIREVPFTATHGGGKTVVVENGNVVCAGDCVEAMISPDARRIDLEGGSISPALITFGSSLGLTEIQQEASTNDGDVADPLTGKVPAIVGGDGSVIRAADGIHFAGRDALLAYRAGVTTGIVAPVSDGFLSGLSTAFSTGAAHKLAKGAVVQEVAALHVAVGSSSASISTQIAALRRLLLGNGEGDLAQRFRDVTQGKLPLVVQVHSADVMASIIHIKQQVEEHYGNAIKLTFTGASEAHLLAKEIGEAGIGVILSPSHPFPGTWESRRILPGPPLTQQSAIAALHANNVTVGIGIVEAWSARNLRFDVGWAALDANGQLSKAEALALASVNLELLLGVNSESSDLVATKGGDLLGFGGKVISVISPERAVVVLF